MDEKKKIPCRVCGKLFKPCAYCQSHADVFRWRNFACSKECAAKYINDTIAYRESLKDKNEELEKAEVVSAVISSEEPIATRKKNIKKTSIVIEDEIENKETE